MGDNNDKNNAWSANFYISLKIKKNKNFINMNDDRDSYDILKWSETGSQKNVEIENNVLYCTNSFYWQQKALV